MDIGVSGLQMADVDLDERVTALEENIIGGTQNGNTEIFSIFSISL